MDSINKNQPEENKKNLQGIDAAKKIKELAKKANTCFFCTRFSERVSFSTRPMSVQKTDDEGNLWFLSADDSNKNMEIEADPYVRLLFQGSHHSDFLSVEGKATITKDKAIIHELWEPIVKTWFTEGEDDPRITAIKIETEKGYYWDTKHGEIVAFAKQLAGAALGKTMDDSIEGTVKI